VLLLKQHKQRKFVGTSTITAKLEEGNEEMDVPFGVVSPYAVSCTSHIQLGK
jgi:hypothetical protein